MIALAQQSTAPAAIDSFLLLVETRAYRFLIGEIDLPEAVDWLQDWADRSGLVRDIGQDNVHAVMAEYFGAAKALMAEPDHAPVEEEQPTAAPKRREERPTPQVTVEALMFCVRERGAAALSEPANIERLSRCDAGAVAEIERRIAKLRSGQ